MPDVNEMNIAASGQDEDHDGLPPNERAVAMLAVGIAVSISVLVGSIANIALPTIARDMHVTPAESIWVVNAYQLAVHRLPHALRLTGRRPRPSPRLHLGSGLLHGRIAHLRPGADHGRVDRRPRPAGHGRRRHHERQRRAGALHLSPSATWTRRRL